MLLQRPQPRRTSLHGSSLPQHINELSSRKLSSSHPWALVLSLQVPCPHHSKSRVISFTSHPYHPLFPVEKRNFRPSIHTLKQPLRMAQAPAYTSPEIGRA